MAEFNIDRIRFRWKDAWNAATVYRKDDIVYYQGKAYVCIIGHTSQSSATGFYTDLNHSSPKWELMLDGFLWRGDWSNSTFYSVGEIVKWEGYVYRCITSHTSNVVTSQGVHTDYSKWTLVATTDNWVNTWTPGYFYDLGDVVTYNGITYRCITKHTADNEANGLEIDQAKWEIVTRSDNWRTDWTTGTRYRVDDVIRYNGVVYRCTMGHTSNGDAAQGLEADIASWTIVIDAIEYVGTWTPGTRYKKNDLVKYGETIWKCVTYHTANANFRVDELSNNWTIWLPGFGYELVWSSATEYQVGDIVLYGGYAYTCLQNNINSVPSLNGLLQDTGNWELLKQGYRHRGEYDHSTQYYTGDVLRSGGYLYICITDSNAEYPDTSSKWQILVVGHKWKSDWVDNTQYYIGDIVTYDGSAYYCILRHTGTESDNRPDLDMANTNENYWQLMLAGIDGNVLTTDGDIRVRDATQTTRLAIGTPGATLKVDGSNNTTWGQFGPVAKVFYVAPTGLDSTANGTTANAPFKTIKYACDYINADWANRAPATIFVTAGNYSEIIPISIPKETTIVGDELRSVTIQPNPGLEANNMFYVSNGGGLRNCTLQGLVGTLGAVNAYGTKRPSAGAFISLDPGTGPADTSVHITSKSSYVQNVTTFGTGCIGIKIDGSLHNAGNKSIVANDFTQIISDGIGVWALNNGRTEIVSIFTYYNYIGYLATDGGKIRATNGNNSYGEFGSVAEGFDSTETAITGTVNNRALDPTANALTDNVNMILALEYKNAGTTNTASGSSVNFGGQGANAAATYQEVRDDAVYEVRLTDPGDSSPAGGNNYQYKLNFAQDGGPTTITLAASDTDGTNTKYAGLRVYIHEGPGVGQYGFIASYDPASKVAQVSRESDGQPGWDHISAGWANVSDMTTATKYSLEPRVTFSDHTYTATTATSPSSSNWEHVIWFPAGNCFVAFTGSSAGNIQSSHSADGITWSAPVNRFSNRIVKELLSDTNGSRILVVTDTFDGSTPTGSIYDFNVAAKSHTNNLAYITSSDFTNLQNLSGAAIKEGTQGAVFATDSHQLRTTTNFNTISTVTPSGASSGTHVYTKLAFGAGVGHASNGTYVAINVGSAGGVAYSTDSGSTFTQLDDDGSGTRLPKDYDDVIFGNGKFVAIQNANDSTGLTKTAISFDGITWYHHSITGATDYDKFVYGGGTFMGLSAGANNQLIKSQEGAVWRLNSDDSTNYLTLATEDWADAAYSPTLQKWSIVAVNSTSFNVISGWGAKPFARAVVKSDKVNEFFIYEPGSQYAATPTVSVYDSQATVNSTQIARIGDGVLPQPVFSNRGLSYITATAAISGNGYADSFQIGPTLRLSGITTVPGPGDNLVINGINDVNYKVSSIDAQSGSGPYEITITISPTLGRAESPVHGEAVTIRQQYSQVRLTGHDFLDIGTGNQTSTDYPNRYMSGYNASNDPKQENEVREANAGRVFYTSTDQDGNFRVGEQFKVEQDTGIITISASQFNLSGLSQLTLGGIVVGGTQVVINEFSKEPTFVANSNAIVPTQKAISRYLESRVSGGTSSANATALIAGTVQINTDTITSTDATLGITFTAQAHHTKSTKGDLAALQYFGHGTDSGNSLDGGGY